MTTPFKFQLHGVRQFHRFGGRCLVCWDVGLGKTLASLLYAQRHDLRPVIVVCPASVKHQWKDEAAKHFQWQADVLEGLRPTANGFITKPRLVILNYDILKGWISWLKNLGPELVVLDECQNISTPKAIRSRLSKELCESVPHVLALSGTPIANRPIELWHPLRIVKPDLFPSMFHYGLEFCAPRKTPWGTWEFKGATKLDVLHDILLAKVMSRVRKEDVINQLPKKTRVVLPLLLTDRQQYEEAENDFVRWLVKYKPKKVFKALSAPALTQLGYLKRLAAELKLPFVLEWLDNWLKTSDGKILVFGIHKAIIKRLHERYYNDCVVIDGSTSNRMRRLAVSKFQKDAKTRLYIGNIRAGGIGLNLTAASTVAFAELDWQPVAHTQAEGRCFARLGDMHGLTAYYFVARSTIEERLLALLERKQKTISAILDNSQEDDFSVIRQLTKEMYHDYEKRISFTPGGERRKTHETALLEKSGYRLS